MNWELNEELRAWYFIFTSLTLYLGVFCLFLAINIFQEFCMANFCKKTQLMLEFLKRPFLSLLFSYNTLTTWLMMPSIILLSMLMILLSTLSVIRKLICGCSKTWPLNLNLTLDLRKKSISDFTAAKTNLCLFEQFIILVLLMQKWKGLFLEQNFFAEKKWCWDCLRN